MEPKDLKFLFLLEAIEKEECQSQRELSSKLNMSLGLVNTFIKDLKGRGFFQTSKESGNGLKYILSPKGIAEKAILTKQYLAYSIRYYNEIKERMSDLFSAFKKSGKNKFVIYGAGELCEIACIILTENKFFKFIIIDDSKAGEKLCGIQIRRAAEIKKMDYDAVVLMDLDNLDVTRRKLRVIGVPSRKIFSFGEDHFFLSV